jgi:hypothetical protein
MIAERIKEIRKGMEWAEISARSGASTLVGASKLNTDVRVDDVKELFRSMNWWKSIGDDNVRSMVLSAMSESHEFIRRTSELFTAILRSRDIPEMWRTAVLSVLYKGKGSRQDPSNSRGISLMPILAKAHEKILVDRIVVFLEANGCFDQNTNGSRKGRSAVDNAMLVQMAAELVILDGGKLLGVFLDDWTRGNVIPQLSGRGSCGRSWRRE